jgi:DNA-binding NarL/FixJ family response regulator
VSRWTATAFVAGATGFGSVEMPDAARRELRRLGVRAGAHEPPTGEESPVESLTAGRLAISGLITARMTDREIAAQLVVSEKTSGSPIRNVFDKLGASSRVEVPRIVECERRLA